MSEVSSSIIVNGLEQSDKDALNEKQRKDLRQLKVDVQKIDEDYIRVCKNFYKINQKEPP